MKPEQIIEEVARLDGFTDIIKDCGRLKGIIERIPNYLNSRDAIVPVIEKQNMTIKDTISGILFSLQTKGEHQFLATPAQLCEALLRAVGKWKD